MQTNANSDIHYHYDVILLIYACIKPECFHYINVGQMGFPGVSRLLETMR